MEGKGSVDHLVDAFFVQMPDDDLVYIAHELERNRVRHRHRSSNNGKAHTWILGNLEHELRLYGHPIWMGPSNGQHESDL